MPALSREGESTSCPGPRSEVGGGIHRLRLFSDHCFQYSGLCFSGPQVPLGTFKRGLVPKCLGEKVIPAQELSWALRVGV